ncbi:M23 family metallopeptidase [Aldersonia sp. NBC_00410]|uniref:M23 family metallopeptidase n=1 Tax=Aldersonia sp. NBC_00410 TaxID=2975954 RepID=UPI00224E2D96|nr:M23 family metallopeptidase [Aldersonia sp. NBC_00410]MCX5043383.1 M23 family metallopeptidase [Aldersonia sp. NBC_00410]
MERARTTSEGHGVVRRRVAYAVIAAAALILAAADTIPLGVDRHAGTNHVLGADQQQQVLMTPRSSSVYMHQIAKGEEVRERHVVEFAARQTLARAKAEAAAAVAGEWQPWLGGSGSGGLGGIGGLGGYALPARGAYTSGFGARWGTMHQGIDIAAPIGSPIYAAASGVVIDAGPASGFGLWVRIRHDDGTITVYGHMYDFFVSVGERVPAGMQIARVGNRGDSTGPHLHFEVIINGQHVDPARWLALHGLSLA